jgi:hypothetical protein
MKLRIELDLPGVQGDDFKEMRGAAWSYESLLNVFEAIHDESITPEHVSVREIDDEDVNG